MRIDDYLTMVSKTERIPSAIQPYCTKVFSDNLIEVYECKPVYEGSEGFGFTFVFAKVSWALEQVKDTVKKINSDKSTPLTSQPCSMFGARCKVEGGASWDAKDGVSYPIIAERHTLYELRPEVLEIKKHIEKLFAPTNPWQDTYSNWVMRCGMSVVKQTHGQRLLKLSKPYAESNYEFIKLVHNMIITQGNNLREIARLFSIVFDNVQVVRSWGTKEWVTEISPNAKTKDSGPQFARFLMDVIPDFTKQRIIDGINTFIMEENEKSGVTPGMGGMDLIPHIKTAVELNELDDPEDDELRKEEGFEQEQTFKWSWRFQHLLFKSPYVEEEDKLEVLSHTTHYYRRMTADIWALQLLEFANISRQFPEEWKDQHVLICIPKRIQGVARGSRDSCDVKSIQWHIPPMEGANSYSLRERYLQDASLVVDVAEDAQRIVVRELTTIAATRALRILIDATNEMIGNRLVTSGTLMARAIELSRSGADGSAMDSTTGATLGLVWYGKTWKVPDHYTAGLWMISIGMGSGRPETMVYNSWLLTRMHEFAGTAIHLVYVVGDDQGFDIYPIQNLVAEFNNKLKIPKTFEFIKTKQTTVIENTERWLNFVLGITTVWEHGKCIGAFRALKTIATKQTPTGVQKRNVFQASGYSYWEERTTITVSDIWQDQSILYVCNNIQDLLNYLRKIKFEDLVRSNPDSPGFMNAII